MIDVFKIKDRYAVKLRGEYYINGEKSLFNGELTVIPEPYIIQTIQNRTRVLQYKRDGVDVSVEYFEAQKQVLLAHFDSEDGTWDSIDSEFAYRKFTQEHIPATETYVEYIQQHFNIVHLAESDNPFIIPLRMMGELKPLFTLNSNPSDLFRAVATELGFVEGKTKGYTWEGSSHTLDTAHYFKVNDTFFSNNTRFKRVSAGTWEECVTAYEFNYELVKKFFLEQKARIENKPLVDRVGLIDKINHILRVLEKVTTTKNTHDNLTFSVKILKELKQSLCE